MARIRKAPVRRTEIPLDRLKRLKRLSGAEELAAEEISTAYAISNGVMLRHDTDIQMPVHRRVDGAEYAANERIDSANRHVLEKYRKWMRDLHRTPALAAAVAVLLNERAPFDLDRAKRQRNGTAMNNLIVALRHFAALRGHAPRGARWRYSKEAA